MRDSTNGLLAYMLRVKGHAPFALCAFVSWSRKSMRVVSNVMKTAAAALCLCLICPAFSQSRESRSINVDEFSKTAGDAPSNPGPRANLSSKMEPTAIKAAMKKVADWEYSRIHDAPSRDWTFAPLYDGFLAASQTLHEPRYHDLVLDAANHFDWKLGTGDIDTNANEHALGYAYIQLYAEAPDERRISDLKREFDAINVRSANRDGGLIWWWCDALFMAPPTWASLSAATGDGRYLSYMDSRYHETDKLLWNPQYHLYSRDKGFLSRREANGLPVFWSRGNGWVLAGLAMVLDKLPANDARRPFYVERFRQMSAAVSKIQSPDGLWRTGLLDPSAYKLPETSGSAFFLYALGWGVNHGVLSAAEYKPVIERGWAGLVSNIYADGRFGATQPVGDRPGKYRQSASYVYGVGAFLLAGSEIKIFSER